MAKKQSPGKKSSSDLSSQAVALAEQLGRIVGTIEGSAEAWMEKASVVTQLTEVRDGAVRLLGSLTPSVAARFGKRPTPKKKAAGRAKGRAADPSRAPGKRHKKPAPSIRGAKKSDQRIPKARAAQAVRSRRKY